MFLLRLVLVEEDKMLLSAQVLVDTSTSLQKVSCSTIFAPVKQLHSSAPHQARVGVFVLRQPLPCWCWCGSWLWIGIFILQALLPRWYWDDIMAWQGQRHVTQGGEIMS